MQFRMRAALLIIPAAFLLSPVVLSQETLIGREAKYALRNGYVPNLEAAVKIAEAVLVPILGKERTEGEEPFVATLKDGVWTVRGSLHCPDSKTLCFGNVAEVRLSKFDSRIFSVTPERWVREPSYEVW